MIKSINASFITSAPRIELAPSFGLSEVAFLGRSNVGKSSLINALVNQKGLAKSSSTPGKTQLINFFKATFEIDDFKEFCEKYGINLTQDAGQNSQRVELVLVDLPGFGYAKVSKSMHAQWQKSLDEFLRLRSDIRLFIQLRDSRHFDLDIDENVSEYLSSFLRPDQSVLRVYTKSDKLNQKELSALKKFDPNALCVSTLKNKGISILKERLIAGAFGV
ncbi:GTP-binding protein [Campylobacter sp. 19-13652]|uniref:GTP-binding protein n=1 Tax=Campylobacter sp. 19-13652 TaxID=2840180 RepID=UPI001C768408|nr:GTPase [Campylobacter sp. 19-13652]BCX79072.1 putative GTP-binding protein EngB [Campylobacter sp. 19-13652]